MLANNAIAEEEDTFDEEEEDFDTEYKDADSAVQAHTARMFSSLNEYVVGCLVPTIAFSKNQTHSIK